MYIFQKEKRIFSSQILDDISAMSRREFREIERIMKKNCRIFSHMNSEAFLTKEEEEKEKSL